MKRSLLETSLLPKLPPLSSKEVESLNSALDLDLKYDLPDVVRQCQSCVITNQRPRIVIDDAGVCLPCHYWQSKKHIDWAVRQKAFATICDKYRRNDGSFDVLVPSSGGKDSAYVALELRDKYGMNPLTVTFSPSLYTEIGYTNFQSHIHHGLNNVAFTADGLVHRRLCRAATIEMGDPFQPFVYGQVNVPLRIAQAYNINLIVDGENGEVEYGGSADTADLDGFDESQSEDYWQSGIPVSSWQDYGFSRQDLYPYDSPSEAVNVRRVFFSYYHNWRPHDNYYYALEKAGFMPNPDRSEGTYSKYASLDDSIDPFHYYFALLKFGIGRATSDAAHEVREEFIERNEALALVAKYDSEPPSPETTKIFLDYTNLSLDQLHQICRKWTNKRIWANQSPRLPALE